MRSWAKFLLERFLCYCFISVVFLLIGISYVYAAGAETYIEKYGEELDHVPFEVRYLFEKSNNIDWDEVDFDTRVDFLKLWDKFKRQESKELRDKEKARRKAEMEKIKAKREIEKEKRKDRKEELKRKREKKKRERERIKAFKKLVKEEKKKLKDMRKNLEKKRRDARRRRKQNRR